MLGKSHLLFMLLISILIILNLQCTSSNNCLEVRIWADQEQYYPLEQIVIHYEIMNISYDSMATTFYAFDQYFDICDDSGNKRPNTLWLSYIFGGDTIAPGTSYVDFEEVGDRYNVNFPGIYTCFMEIPKDAVYPECLDNVKSNELVITIIDPTGMEKEAYLLFRHADSLHWEGVSQEEKKKSRRKSYHLYLELAAKYPESVYAPKALYSAIVMSNAAESRLSLIGACQTLIENYPHSPDLKWAFFHLIENYGTLKDKTGAVEYMEYLLDKFPDNPIISERAEFWLKKLKKEGF